MIVKKSKSKPNTTPQNSKGRRMKKTPTTFKMSLTEEQKRAKAIALESQVTIFTGRAGTSKTFLSCNIALDLLIQGAVEKIIVTRPMIDVGKSMGFLPGNAFDFKEGKMAPYLAPVLQTMYELRSKAEIDAMIIKEQIVIIPVQFVRGQNFKDCVVLVDEAQNLNDSELKALTTRICNDAYMIFTSDVAQIDLYDKSNSAGYLFNAISKLKGVGTFELTENFRSPLALEIMDIIEQEKKKTQ